MHGSKSRTDRTKRIMKVLITGSAGHLGEALARTLTELHHEVIGLDLLDSAFTTHIGSITDRLFVKRCLEGVTVVFHTATLHKPHIVTHSLQQFVDTNITGALTLLQEAVGAGVAGFIYTSTTSVFGDALVPPADAPAAWITEDVAPVPKNIYGVTKKAAEDLCQLFYRNNGLACIVLRTSRFFPEADDNKSVRQAYSDDNLKANEYLFRRVSLDDAMSAHLLAAEQVKSIGFGTYIISATTPFSPDDRMPLRTHAPAVVKRLVPGYEAEYQRRGWQMFPSIDRVYCNDRARNELGWQPRYDFSYIIDRLTAGRNLQTPLAQLIGLKGYHDETFTEGPYPMEA